jgi:DNA-binding transcriptional MocR family regulator
MVSTCRLSKPFNVPDCLNPVAMALSVEQREGLVEIMRDRINLLVFQEEGV